MTKIAATPASHLSGVAIWRRIADAIRLDIVGGKLAQGDKLPTETELAERFNANRHTVRRALAALQSEGVIKTEQGRGSFVDQARRLSYKIGRRTRFSENLADQATALNTQHLGHRLENASAAVAHALAVRAGEKVIRIEGLSSADGRPVSRATTWLSYRQFPEFAERIVEHRSFTAVFSLYGIADYVRASTRISARHADVEETKLLGLSPGSIVLVSEAIDADADGKPLSYGLSRFPADRLELVV